MIEEPFSRYFSGPALFGLIFQIFHPVAVSTKNFKARAECRFFASGVQSMFARGSEIFEPNVAVARPSSGNGKKLIGFSILF